MYATLMVYLDPFADNTYLLRIASDLAERFDASMLCVSAGRQVGVADDVGAPPGGVINVDREELDEALEATREAALDILQRPGRHIEWRCSMVDSGPLDAAVVRETRSADLVIAAANYRGSLAQDTRYLNLGNLVIQSGRPVLIIPPATTRLAARNVLVGWKDTREARRAASDALPLLQTADRVLVIQIAGKKDFAQAREAVADVVRWLKRHGVSAEGTAVAERGSNALQLDAVAKAEGIDLIVAGAYGHSRLREWALGGVTRNLLLYGDLCALVSH